MKLLGARVANTPKDAIELSECIMLMLTNAQAVEEMLFASNADLKGRMVIQLSTISPQESIAISKEVLQQGGNYLEAPVLGSLPQAEQGTLLVMVGGTVEDYTIWKPLLTQFSLEPIYISITGKAAALKLALNHLIASHIVSFALSLGIVQREGIEVDLFMRILRKSALYAPMFDSPPPKILSHDFSHPNFPMKHLLKDVDLVLSEVGSLGLETSV